MKANRLFIAWLLVLAACAPVLEESVRGTGSESALQVPATSPLPTSPAAGSTEAAPAAPTMLPTPEATLAVFNPLSPPRPDDVSVEHITSFALLPDNRANGQAAPDFSARLMGGGTFTLSEARGSYWLVLPTAMGCGECMFSLGMLTQALPVEKSNLNVLVLDIYEPDQPEYWLGYLGYFEGLEAQWSVVNGGTFVVDYEIFGLGNFLVIDPDGALVYHSDSPPRLEYITHMFTLANRQRLE